MILYSFEVVEVNKPFNSMLVKYTAEGHSDRLVATRMPFIGENIEDVVAEYAPIPLWIQENLEIADIEVGTKGTVDSSPQEPSAEASSELLVSEEEQIEITEALNREIIREVVLEVMNEQS